ncbi:TadE family protein [Methylobacterium nodulans ORS 2060]|uniref:TadE family protein n=2 Tax=Methylobacterium nodulans TaxID=114616 RepID=B8IRF2_METNO|nr:TadE/TadG family type IV pilus assembly protein [Methylobacterium nodulans]ACL58692.1 TadE family protein [Methylobacterium nodulans ORS 2060]
MSALRRFCACRSGSTAVEFAMVGMIMLVTMLGIVELGRGLNVRNQLSQAADFGARAVLMNKTISDSGLEAVIRAAFQAASPDQLQVTVGAEVVNGLQFRTVSVSYPFVPLTWGFSTGTINLSVSRRTPVI